MKGGNSKPRCNGVDTGGRDNSFEVAAELEFNLICMNTILSRRDHNPGCTPPQMCMFLEAGTDVQIYAGHTIP